MRVFDQIRDLEIPITLCPQWIKIDTKLPGGKYRTMHCKNMSRKFNCDCVFFYDVPYLFLNVLPPEAKGVWYFRISDLVKNPDGTDI